MVSYKHEPYGIPAWQLPIFFLQSRRNQKPMKSLKPGKSTSAPEISHISLWGVWVLFEDNEYFLNYKEFPWFRSARVEQIHHVKREGRRHLHWPDLDIDLDLDRIREPEKFPLVTRLRS
jgi:hypothetical protein